MKQTLKAAAIMTLLAMSTLSPQAALAEVERPKLVVGIVVDQMRWDYLYRYSNRYGEGGFNRLLQEGNSCENNRLQYVPAITAIGHASIYTGSVPSIHGIAGNAFLIGDRFVSSVEDDNVQSVGTTTDAGKASPHNMLTTTIGDELKIATNGRSKVIGIALKDRASILPAGHSANAAYWFDDAIGKFVTSTHYMKELPEWVNSFNNKKLPDQLMTADWTTLYPMETYTQSTADANEYENPLVKGAKYATMPLELRKLLKENGYGIIRSLPAGNTLTAELAKAAIEGEKLGEDGTTDFLAISFSSTDYLGHAMGTHAVETEDMYLRLDQTLADFFNFLDSKVGKGNYLLFLTADHGAMNNPTYLQDMKIPALTWGGRSIKEALNDELGKTYGAKDLVRTIMCNQIYYNMNVVDSLGLDFDAVKATTVKFLLKDPKIQYACDMEKARTSSIPTEISERIVNGYNNERSGSVQFITKASYIENGPKGTGHSMWNPYDTHTPLIFMGWHIEQGETTRETFTSDIASTICTLLHIQAPNGSIGHAIDEVIKKK